MGPHNSMLSLTNLLYSLCLTNSANLRFGGKVCELVCGRDSSCTEQTMEELNEQSYRLALNKEKKKANSIGESKTIGYIHSKELIDECDRAVKVKHRASMVHELIRAYALLPFLGVIRPKLVTHQELTEFHCGDYIEHLIKVNALQDLERMEQDSLKYGLGYDCPLIPRLFDYVAHVAGGTLSAARCLVERTHKVVINWTGGWHHCKKDEASGFCYVNDIVLGILRLRTTFDKILYIDLDLHHGDGVEEAFAFTTKVMTVSLHKYERGFFPGSGHVTDVGCGRARYHSVNVPLNDGIGDKQYFHVFQTVCQQVMERFRPNAVVCQCGADVLSGDPMSSFCLTPKGLGMCVRAILDWDLPTLFLGGGGYNFPNTARCWAYLTSVIVGQNISSDIPENPYFVHYGPAYDLEITPSNRPNQNDKITTNKTLNFVFDNLMNINNV